jgi:hypothetical protein
MLTWADTHPTGTVRLGDLEREVGQLSEQLRFALAPDRHERGARGQADLAAASHALSDLGQLVDQLARHFPRFGPRIRATAWRHIATSTGAAGGEQLAALVGQVRRPALAPAV